jgi:HEAT repeat protein
MYRAWALEALGEIGKKETIPWVVKGLEDLNSTVSSYAAEAMGRIGDREVIPYLEMAVQHSHWHVRRLAAKALKDEVVVLK